MDYNDIKRINKNKKKRKTRVFALIAKLLVVLLIIFTAVFVIVQLFGEKKNNEVVVGEIMSTAAPVTEQTPTPTQEATPTPPPVTRRGTAQPIPQEVRNVMLGKSMPSNATISFDQLSYLTIPHYDFNYNVTTGYLVVNASVAEDVLDIFAELFDIKYPIERMELIDKYNASDYDSIDANNTSAFNYRMSTDGSGRLSNHALGYAIDINPRINPYVNSNGTGAHPNAREYWSRNFNNWSSDIAKAAYIGPEAEIYNIFMRHGWEWGGAWSSYRDYQHFEK